MSRSWVSSALVCSLTVIVNGVGNHDDDVFQCVKIIEYFIAQQSGCGAFCGACASLTCNGLSSLDGIDTSCSYFKQNCHCNDSTAETVNDIARQIVPLSNLNFDAYLGRWYQTYVSLSAPFQIGATCVTADYGTASDGKTVTVKNKSLYNDPSIGFFSVEGYAPRNPNGSGELQVKLGRPGQPVTKIPEWNENPSNYIVAAVGPIVEGLYDYAIVGDPAGTILYVLARDVERFEEQHKEKVLQQTQDLGFTDDSNRPRKTIQEGCSYREVDEVASGKISNTVV